MEEINHPPFVFREMLAAHLLIYTFQHTFFDWLKFTRVPPNHVGPMWILTNQRECVEKCVLEGVLLTFFLFLYSLIKLFSPLEGPQPTIIIQYEDQMEYIYKGDQKMVAPCRLIRRKWIKISL